MLNQLGRPHRDERLATDTLLLRGNQLATTLITEIRWAREALMHRGGQAPALATVLVGASPASLAYRSSIERTLQRVDVAHLPVTLEERVTPTALIRVLRRLGRQSDVTGILVLMPLPAHLPIEIVYEHLPPLKDVDGVTPLNAGRLHLGLPSLLPSTPQGGIELLDHYQIPMQGQRAVVLGRSNVVGKPLAALLLQRNATVTVCHRQSVDVAALTREADIVALAVGQPRYLSGNMIRPGATVLDFGINVERDGIVGDADFESLIGVAGAITPVPGGTGPITSLILARNTITAGFSALAGHIEDFHDLPAHPDH